MRNIDNALMECYTLLYKHSTPSADFQTLMDNAIINERGQKEIQFNDYLIDETQANEIIESMIKKYKIKGYQIQQFKTTILLGCSPKFKRNGN